jgi:hypothetical protein
VICVVSAGFALLVWPQRWQAGAGVIGGGCLVALSAWAIRGLVDGLARGGTGRTRSGVLVKFFTRHVILAFAAYAMMVRLRVDPIGVLVGVSSLALAAGVEGVRRWPPHRDGDKMA